MSNTYFEILRAGINTTAQDEGRNHMYHLGITVSGAIDQRNYKLSNKLVNNSLSEVSIEFAYQGPLLKLKNGKINFSITGEVMFKIIRKTLKVEEGKKNVNEGKGNQFSPGYFRSLDEALGVATKNEAYTRKLNDEISDKTSKTAVTSSAPSDLSNNITLFRAKVDAGVASMFAERDVNLAAYKYSRIGMVEGMSPDAYGVAAQNDLYARGRQKTQQEHQEKMLDKKILADVKKVMLEQGVKNGSFIGIEPVNKELGVPLTFK